MVPNVRITSMHATAFALLALFPIQAGGQNSIEPIYHASSTDASIRDLMRFPSDSPSSASSYGSSPPSDAPSFSGYYPPVKGGTKDKGTKGGDKGTKGGDKGTKGGDKKAKGAKGGDDKKAKGGPKDAKGDKKAADKGGDKKAKDAKRNLRMLYA
jgi:hypothetical protein